MAIRVYKPMTPGTRQRSVLTSEEITKSISQVNEMSTQTTQAMNAAAKAITDLAQQTENLGTLINDMKAS